MKYDNLPVESIITFDTETTIPPHDYGVLQGVIKVHDKEIGVYYIELTCGQNAPQHWFIMYEAVKSVVWKPDNNNNAWDRAMRGI